MLLNPSSHLDLGITLQGQLNISVKFETGLDEAKNSARINHAMYEIFDPSNPFMDAAYAYLAAAVVVFASKAPVAAFSMR
jgi:hypothetical protein